MKLHEMILDIDRFDKILLKLCNLIKMGRDRDPKSYGLVGSAVVDYKNPVIGRTARFRNGLWSHAEREAISAYENKFGNISKNCIIITTLSPCNELYSDPAPERYGDSCTNLINESGIKMVYCGYEDPSQGNDQHDRANFKLITSKDAEIKELCKFYADQFLIKQDF